MLRDSFICYGQNGGLVIPPNKSAKQKSPVSTSRLICFLAQVGEVSIPLSSPKETIPFRGKEEQKHQEKVKL